MSNCCTRLGLVHLVAHKESIFYVLLNNLDLNGFCCCRTIGMLIAVVFIEFITVNRCRYPCIGNTQTVKN